jgi:hypothetical protein
MAFARCWKTLWLELSEVIAMDSSFAYLFGGLDKGRFFASESILLGYRLV